MNFPKLKFVTEIQKANRILLAGAGGGFDIFCGLPLLFDLLEIGKEVHLANFSFADIESSTGKEITPSVREIKANSQGVESYFPELHLARWLARQGLSIPIYAFGNIGVKPLAQGYEALHEKLGFDTVVLIDGGTDSLMRGDEADLGTPVEDATSIAAVHFLKLPIAKYLVCLGFGVDSHHGVPHRDVLEAVSDLARSGHYLGAWSLTPDMSSVEKYRDAFNTVHQAMPHHPSIVSSSVLDAIFGEFGNFHRTERTQGSELFINPLMGLYWAFSLEGIAQRNLYLELIRETQNHWDVRAAIEVFRGNLKNNKTVEGNTLVNPEILNTGLNLAMEWGKDWLKPIQSRLVIHYPQLSPDELDRYNTLCQEAMKFGHDLIYSLHNQHTTSEIQSYFRSQLKEKYPWVSDENLGRLFSQGMYYAMK